MYYIIENGVPKLEPDLNRWGKWFEQADDERRVGLTKVGKIEVSTVFLGLDHNYSHEGSPILFETMVFGGDGEPCWRYCTREEALTGHKKVVAYLRKHKNLKKFEM